MPAVVAIPLMLLMSVALPAVLTTVIIYGRSYQRTFCIGAMFPSGIFLLMVPYGSMGLFSFGANGPDDFWFRLVVFGFWVFCVVLGGVCVGVRRLVEKRPLSPPDQGNVGPQARTAIAALAELLKDKDENVRRAVAEALEKIENEEK